MVESKKYHRIQGYNSNFIYILLNILMLLQMLY